MHTAVYVLRMYFSFLMISMCIVYDTLAIDTALSKKHMRHAYSGTVEGRAVCRYIRAAEEKTQHVHTCILRFALDVFLFFSSRFSGRPLGRTRAEGSGTRLRCPASARERTSRCGRWESRRVLWSTWGDEQGEAITPTHHTAVGGRPHEV